MIRRSPLLAILASAATSLAGCGAPDTASPAVSGAPPTDASVQPSPSATPSASATLSSPSGTPLTAELAWSVEAFAGRVDAIAADQGRLVAAGRHESGLAVWISDGSTWQPHAVPDPTFIEDLVADFGPQLYEGTRMGPITRLDDTLFSLGTFFGPNDFYRPVGWRSADGLAWEFIESESPFYGYGAITDAESFGGSLLVARGEGLTGPIYSLWQWTLQSSWQRSSVRSTDDRTIEALDIAVVGGVAVAVGEVATSDPDVPADMWPRKAVAWRSSDGMEWEAIDLPDDIDLACSVTATATSGFVVLGRDPDGKASAWKTADGSQWAKSELGRSETRDGCRGYSLTRTDSWLAATTPASGGAGLWLSESGDAWARQEIPELHSMQIAELNRVLYVLGATSADGSLESLLIRGTPS